MSKRSTVVVVGGSGSIGSAITKRLAEQGQHVTVVSRDAVRSTQKMGIPRNFVSGRTCTVETPSWMNTLAKSIAGSYTISAVIYCVGHCPPGGFGDEVRRPISELRGEDLDRWMKLIPLGFAGVMRAFLPRLELGGCVVAIGSAATRFMTKPSDLPPNAHIFHYVAAQLALDAYVEGFRRTPVRDLTGVTPIHLIKPAAVDTPFHLNSRGPKVAIQTVVDAVMQVLPRREHQTHVLMPN